MSNSTQVNNNEKPTRRKTGVVKQSFKSESVYLSMRKTPGTNLNNAMYRMGELFKMTSRSHDKQLHNQLVEWFNTEVLIPAELEIASLESQLAALRDDSDSGIEFISIKNPDMFLEIDIIHKSHIQILSLLTKVDFLMEDIELLLLSNIDDDDGIEESSRTNMNLIINNMSRKIFTVTKPGKRNGGAFSAVYFIQQLQQGVFSLFPEIGTTLPSDSSENQPNIETENVSEILNSDSPNNELNADQPELAKAV
ncbi:hypothetical protein [Shewanella sp. UCD-KL12]|uniref:hypothetical protein n=1 Tax=Shewanella sp. UCD-KL12 TaxID=1917163 RepID=UPI000970A4DE|nr:hypothetical protein [Shewanella sp. UCD-KL12]